MVIQTERQPRLKGIAAQIESYADGIRVFRLSIPKEAIAAAILGSHSELSLHCSHPADEAELRRVLYEAVAQPWQRPATMEDFRREIQVFMAHEGPMPFENEGQFVERLARHLAGNLNPAEGA